jgi:hypothetical protein
VWHTQTIHFLTIMPQSVTQRFAWSGIGIGEGSTMRVTFPFCNFFNKKYSNISPVNLQPHYVFHLLYIPQTSSNLRINYTYGHTTLYDRSCTCQLHYAFHLSVFGETTHTLLIQCFPVLCAANTESLRNTPPQLFVSKIKMCSPSMNVTFE